MSLFPHKIFPYRVLGFIEVAILSGYNISFSYGQADPGERHNVV